MHSRILSTAASARASADIDAHPATAASARDDLAASLENIARVLSGEVHMYEMEKRYVRKNGAVVGSSWACRSCAARMGSRSTS